MKYLLLIATHVSGPGTIWRSPGSSFPKPVPFEPRFCNFVREPQGAAGRPRNQLRRSEGLRQIEENESVRRERTAYLPIHTDEEAVRSGSRS